jgi:hypothetical protein
MNNERQTNHNNKLNDPKLIKKDLNIQQSNLKNELSTVKNNNQLFKKFIDVKNKNKNNIQTTNETNFINKNKNLSILNTNQSNNNILSKKTNNNQNKNQTYLKIQEKQNEFITKQQLKNEKVKIYKENQPRSTFVSNMLGYDANIKQSRDEQIKKDKNLSPSKWNLVYDDEDTNVNINENKNFNNDCKVKELNKRNIIDNNKFDYQVIDNQREVNQQNMLNNETRKSIINNFD